MNPATIGLILQALGLAGGALGLGRRKDTSTQQLLEMVARYTNPQMVLGDARQYYDAWLKSPEYSHSLSGVNLSANRAASDVASSLAYRGMTGTGVGSLLSGLGSNTAGFKMADLRSQGWMNALTTAQNIASSRLQGAGYLKGPRDIGLDTGAGLLDWLGKINVKDLVTSGTPKQTPKSALSYTGGYQGDPTDSVRQFAQLYQR